MPGPVPKSAGERRRRNKVAGARTLAVVAPGDVDVPALPMEAHPMTIAWWADVWASPMSPEFDRSDVHGLIMLAVLIDQFWRVPSKDLAAEIRLQRQAFGLSPLDRRRLQWEIERGSEAAERTKARKSSARPRAARDPRVSDGGTQGTQARQRPSA